MRFLFAIVLAALEADSSIQRARSTENSPASRPPNVVLIITDDQGYGDLGCHGNPVLRTPHLDELARQSVELVNFYVSPVCAPTRASLLTGRYNYRTGAVDTYLGRALMHADETTLAEILAAAGYRTGIFGKWHLGDNYPLRAMDQGFAESLVLKGGGIGQPSDPPGGSSYFDPVLQRDGQAAKSEGYCSDVFTAAALEFIDRNRSRPFFAYLAFNAPHEPLEVPERYLDKYRAEELGPAAFPHNGQPLPERLDTGKIARVYGMVSNIDDNVGRLLARLDELGLARDTIVVFLTDNGPQQARYNAGLRGLKGSVYEGGIRVPCYVRWPTTFPAWGRVEQPAAHIDLAPTLLEACGVSPPDGVKFDGRSLLPLLQGKKPAWQERTLYFQWHRGDVPERERAFAARDQRWKLVQPLGAAPGPFSAPRFELYDLIADPFELHDVAAAHADVVADLRRRYGDWFDDVSGTRGFDPPRIVVGTRRETPTVLTRQDWRGPLAGWGPNDRGHWELQVAEAGEYRITLAFAPGGDAAILNAGGQELEQPLALGDSEVRFEAVRWRAGPLRLKPGIRDGDRLRGVLSAQVERLD